MSRKGQTDRKGTLKNTFLFCWNVKIWPSWDLWNVFYVGISVGMLMVVVLLPPLCPATTMSTIVPTRQGGHQRRRRRRGVVGGGMTMTTMTTMTKRIWTRGERRGKGKEKDDGTTTIVHDMGNIHTYLLAVMTGGTMTRTFLSARHWISARRLTTFLPWPYCCGPFCCCCHCRQGWQRRWQVDMAIKDLWLFPLQMMTMALNKNVNNDNVITWIQATARPPSPSPPMPDARGAIVTTWIAMATIMHAATAAWIMGETTRVLKIIKGTMKVTGITMQCHVTTNKWRARQEVELLVERRREATEQHNNQPNKRGVMERQEADAPAEGFGKLERAADKRTSWQEGQQRFFVAGCVGVCDIFYLFLVYMLGNCYILAGGIKKELVFAGT